jgi:anti-sigma regulatory factor (Ser/Thr protein kinase)
VSGAEAITSLIHDKYEDLCNCVSYDARQIATLTDELCQNIEKHDGSRYDGTEVRKELLMMFLNV